MGQFSAALLKCFLIRLSILLLPVTLCSAEESTDVYQQVLKPILRDRCFACHGVLKQEGGLRLDTAMAIRQGGDSGGAVDPGNADASLMVRRTESKDAANRMPPEGEPLKPAESAALRAWIAAGAVAPAGEQGEEDPREHWAFRTPVRPPLPTDIDDAWVQTPVDAFISAAHHRQTLRTQASVDRLSWLRRVTLDLTGLPPGTADQVAFLADQSDGAFERVVDRLLASPQYGERWGRHWMDIWRYSDWWGLGAEVRNSQKHIWHWRDWVVESVNSDKGYDQMLREMLAADELYPTDMDKLRATGFLARQYFKFNRTSWLDETVQHTFKAMLGMTFNCAKCHDHKYDPITQAEYYGLRAFFEPYQIRTESVGGELDFERDGIPRAFDCNLTAETWIHIRGDDRNPDRSRPIIPTVPAFLPGVLPPIEPVRLPPEAIQPGLRQEVLATMRAAAAEGLTKARANLESAVARCEKVRLAAATAPEPGPIDEATTLLDEHFAEWPTERWRSAGGVWMAVAGGLQQTQAGASEALLQLQQPLPEDFEAQLEYTPVSGEMWKSAGLHFDTANGDRVTVYLSSYAAGPKVQVAWRQGGVQDYPQDAMQQRKVDLNQRQRLTVRVRGQLLNVLVNDELAIVKRLPFARRAGGFELMAFDCAAIFHHLLLKTLPATVSMQGEDSAVSVEAALAAVQSAESQVRRAEAEIGLIEVKVAAELAAIQHPESEESARTAAAAVSAERAVAILAAEAAVAESRRLQTAAAPEKRPELLKAVEQSEAALTALRSSPLPAAWTPLKGALKTLESNVETEESRRRPFPRTSTGRRSALAAWITASQNPLTARVAVNHMWVRHFGRGLVSSVFDFGRKGARPTHPELLDWLAVELMEHGWSMKHMHRLIVLSATYRMRSTSLDADPETLARDPENRWYWRGSPVRLEAQSVRDSLLSLSGEIDLTTGGPTIPISDEGSRRRSLYYFHSHNEHQKFLSMFDDANVLECYRRADSIVPQQALALENSPLVQQAALRITEVLTREAAESAGPAGGTSETATDLDFVRRGFRLILCCEATDAELEAGLEFLAQMREEGEQAVGTPDQARRALVMALLNHNDFMMVR
ncbi:MAG: hypothetical protein RIT02_391 [Planctomycetota bacterium]